MKNSEIRPARPDDIAAVSANMRKADRIECRAMTGLDHAKTLRLSCESSPFKWVVLYDGEPVAIFGVGESPYLEGVGSPWLLGTDRLPERPLFLMREAKRFIEEARGRYEFMFNHVLASSRTNIRFLKRLGFSFDDKPIKAGPMGRWFYRFYMDGV